MTIRPRLFRSTAYWILIVVSAASTALGATIVVSKLSSMTTTLTNGSATGVDVYAGQSWIMFGCALLAAGLVGIFAAFGLAVVRSLLATVAPSDDLEPAVPALPAPDATVLPTDQAAPVTTDAGSGATADADATVSAGQIDHEATNDPAETAGEVPVRG